MPNFQALEQFIAMAASNGRRLVIKDFVGFLDWLPEMKRVLKPYTRHASSFCRYAKSNISVYHRCINCVNALQWRCRRAREPFWATCVNGVSERHYPITCRDIPLGVISMGNYCLDMRDAAERLDRLSCQYGLDKEMLHITYSESLCAQAPKETEMNVQLGILCEYIANVCEPLIQESSIRLSNIRTPSNAYEKILGYIAKNFTDPSITLEDIAAACNYSQSSVSHIFHDNMHMNIRRYINQLRITMSEKLLRDGTGIADTALACGFNDPSYFTNLFHREIGISPVEYRNRRVAEQPIRFFEVPADAKTIR